MFNRLVRPFKKRYNKYASKVNGFVNPIKDAVKNLLGYIPHSKAFAGSEDQGDDAEGSVGSCETGAKKGLLARLKNFKKSLKEMSDFQKLILLTIAVCLPAGILISTFLVGFIKSRKK